MTIREIDKVSVKKNLSDDVGEYWMLRIGAITLFVDQDWLTYLATKIAEALPAEEQGKIIEAISDMEMKEIAEQQIEAAPKEKINA